MWSQRKHFKYLLCYLQRLRKTTGFTIKVERMISATNRSSNWFLFKSSCSLTLSFNNKNDKFRDFFRHIALVGQECRSGNWIHFKFPPPPSPFPGSNWSYNKKFRDNFHRKRWLSFFRHVAFLGQEDANLRLRTDKKSSWITIFLWSIFVSGYHYSIFYCHLVSSRKAANAAGKSQRSTELSAGSLGCSGEVYKYVKKTTVSMSRLVTLRLQLQSPCHAWSRWVRL